MDGVFLWHFPSGHPAPPLAGILPGGARTFLPLISFTHVTSQDGDRPAALNLAYCSMLVSLTLNHIKINSRIYANLSVFNHYVAYMF